MIIIRTRVVLCIVRFSFAQHEAAYYHVTNSTHSICKYSAYTHHTQAGTITSVSPLAVAINYFGPAIIITGKGIASVDDVCAGGTRPNTGCPGV